MQTNGKINDKKKKKRKTGILTVLLSTYNKEQKVFEGELSVLIKK